jgi:type II secretory pathway component PulC
VKVEQAGAADRAAAVAEAEKSMEAALQSLEQARALLESDRAALAGAAHSKAEQDKAVAQAREELSRAHRQLREASRDIARAHREMALADREVRIHRWVGMGGRPVIGVVLGEESPAGIELLGVSPGGPAERAGLKQGDIITAIGGVDLTGRTDGSARPTLSEAIRDATEGKELALTALRDDKTMELTVTPESREPLSWQSMVPSPSLPPGTIPPPDEPLPPGLVEGLEMAPIDEAAMEARVQEMTERAEELTYMLIGEDGDTIVFNPEIAVDGGPMSPLGRHALDEMDIRFDLPRTRGLELARLNPELGRYFKADRGVLVIQAVSGNAYGLEAGDVIKSVDKIEVTSPADLMRTLRDLEPGTQIELGIKRDKRDRTLSASVPTNLLGFSRTPPAY